MPSLIRFLDAEGLAVEPGFSAPREIPAAPSPAAPMVEVRNERRFIMVRGLWFLSHPASKKWRRHLTPKSQRTRKRKKRRCDALRSLLKVIVEPAPVKGPASTAHEPVMRSSRYSSWHV